VLDDEKDLQGPYPAADPAVIGYRPFRNTDVLTLAALWNDGLPQQHVIRPLTGHEFDALVIGRIDFDRAGMIVAEDENLGPVGFVHAGFGPVDPFGAWHALDHSIGTVAVLVVGPGERAPEVASELLARAIGFLKKAGAMVVYAGGQYPLNPFYWGLYGGSEFAGVLQEHALFHETVRHAGFEPVSATSLLELDLATGEVRDARTILARRQYQVDVEEDALPSGWWDALALHDFHPNRYRVSDKRGGPVLAEAWTYEMGAELPVADHLIRRGMFRLEVDPSHRRRGIGRLLVVECLKHARSQLIDRFSIQTASSNTPALALYRAVGFSLVGESILYRLPGGRTTSDLLEPSNLRLTEADATEAGSRG
jgi:ribosomal protein S18 acetylase RimI-like enzyme